MPLATLPQPPPTVSPWAKILWYLVESVAITAGYKAYEAGASFLGFGGSSSTENPETWRRFSFQWENTISLEPSDDVYFTIDIANITSGLLDGTWTDNDYIAVGPYLDAIATTLAPVVASHLTLTHIRSYVMGFNDYANPKPFIESGPPEHVATKSIVGALAQPAGAPMCTTVTEMTPLRLHWGRFYSPSIGANALVGGGRLASQYVNSIAAGVRDNYQGLMALQFFPVVPTTQSDKMPLRALQAVTGVRVDDVPDVQRSRRPKRASLRVTWPVAAVTEPADA